MDVLCAINIHCTVTLITYKCAAICITECWGLFEDSITCHRSISFLTDIQELTIQKTYEIQFQIAFIKLRLILP